MVLARTAGMGRGPRMSLGGLKAEVWMPSRTVRELIGRGLPRIHCRGVWDAVHAVKVGRRFP